MLGQPISMLIPEVIGFRFTGALPEGVTATDLVLTVTQMLRKKGVVGKFVEYFGNGLDSLSVEDRATMANMAPEYGATCGFFPVDKDTIGYLRATGRDPHRVALVEAYAKAQGLWRDAGALDPVFTEHARTRSVDGRAEPCRARAARRIAFRWRAPSEGFVDALAEMRNMQAGRRGCPDGQRRRRRRRACWKGPARWRAKTTRLRTAMWSSPRSPPARTPPIPSVLIAAGLVARKAREKGLKAETLGQDLARARQSGRDGLSAKASGLQRIWMRLASSWSAMAARLASAIPGRCPSRSRKPSTTTIWSSPPSFPATAISKAASIRCPRQLSGLAAARGRLCARGHDEAQPCHRAAWRPDKDGAPVYLKDIWPLVRRDRRLHSRLYHAGHVQGAIRQCLRRRCAVAGRRRLEDRADLRVGQGSTYVQNPPYFEDLTGEAPSPLTDIENARVLGLFLDFDHNGPHQPRRLHRQIRPRRQHISSAISVGVADFNSYGARRGNHEVMMRGTFANIRIKNQMVPGVEGGVTIHHPDGEQMPIYDAAMRYKARRRAACDLRRPRIRHGLKPRLGRKGDAASWRARGDRAELRAHPSLEPRRHGRAAAGVRGGRVLARTLGLKGSETVTIHGVEQFRRLRKLTASIAFADGDQERRSAALPDRYAGRAELLQKRRHSALRAAEPCGGLKDSSALIEQDRPPLAAWGQSRDTPRLISGSRTALLPRRHAQCQDIIAKRMKTTKKILIVRRGSCDTDWITKMA